MSADTKRVAIFPIAVVIGAAITLLLFYFMYSLITTSATKPRDSDNPTIDFSPVKLEAEAERKNRVRPKKPPPPKEPPPPPKMKVAQQTKPVNQMPSMDMPNLDLAANGDGPALGAVGYGVDRNAEGDVIPLVRIPPQYPRKAAMAKIEGWVKVEFTITEEGTVTNPHVLESKPPRIFDREALRAILKWKFKPKIVDGVRVPQIATQTIEFKLEG